MSPGPESFRSNLAGELSETPKEERAEKLDRAKESPEYWQARQEKLAHRQEEEIINDGQGIFLKKKTLYHGSATSGIENFQKAQDNTVGSGVYFTSTAQEAIGYAKVRSVGQYKNPTEGEIPFIYEASVENVKLLDLRSNENLQSILPSYRALLFEKCQDPNLLWNVQGAYLAAIDSIDRGNVRSAKTIAANTGHLFTEYIKNLGYDGLVTIEGGEGNIGDHDTYLIFDPEKIKVWQEHKITQ